MSEWDDFFAGIDTGELPAVSFPGARPPKPPTAGSRREKKESPTGWDTSARRYRVGGEEKELFPIRALAEALDRKVPTIRSWERKGFLPQARVRAPRVDGILGHRLYSRAFIEGLQEIAEQERLYEVGVEIATTTFPARAAALMEKTNG